tara:strand:+ start:201 stop:683 length:483 start_codon:yes stop_codon:yes gene_type:complete
MKYYFLIIIFLINQNVFSSELSCIFEEVHQNGDTHQGTLIIKDDKFRYEYFSHNLYTIIHKDNLFFYVENRDKTKYFKISKNIDLLESIVNIIGDFPSIKQEYYINDSLIKVEYSKTDKIIKRIIVLSNELKMSVYLNDCKDTPLKDIYFSWSPFWQYNH